MRDVKFKRSILDATSHQLTFTHAQLRSAAKIAKEHGVSVRFDPDGSITIAPSTPEAVVDSSRRAFEALARQDVEESDFEAALAKMDPNSRKVLSGGYIWEYDDFVVHMANKPLSKRETVTLRLLAKLGAGLQADFRQVKLGPSTQARLEARGYIKLHSQDDSPDLVSVSLTKDGLKAWEAL